MPERENVPDDVFVTAKVVIEKKPGAPFVRVGGEQHEFKIMSSET